MCLYPRFIKNKRYLGYTTKKPNKGNATTIVCNDYRKLYVPIGCGECYECRKQKAQQWRVRLMEELKEQKNAYFVTLTFANESIISLLNNAKRRTKYHYDPNEIATIAVRRFLERWRKKYKNSLRHWLITELGQENTERVHLHGILFSNTTITKEELAKIWKYGRTDIGEYCNERTINYIVKYVTKIDITHKNYKPIVLCSSGIGANYTKTIGAQRKYIFDGENTPEFYTLKNGQKIALPIYYRNKFYTQEERDKLWTQRLDKKVIYVNGIECDISTESGLNYYYRLLANKQKWNIEIGYGSTNKEWSEKNYKAEIDAINKKNGICK